VNCLLDVVVLTYAKDAIGTLGVVRGQELSSGDIRGVCTKTTRVHMTAHNPHVWRNGVVSSAGGIVMISAVLCTSSGGLRQRLAHDESETGGEGGWEIAK
jgi:hypothetical protein